MAHIPRSAFDMLRGKADNQDIYALQATPIIGNAYGFSYIFNAMKHDKKEPKEETYDIVDKTKEKLNKDK